MSNDKEAMPPNGFEADKMMEETFGRTEDGPRAWTGEEAAGRFVAHCIGIAKSWADHSHISKEEACEGVVHSILAALDGSSPGIPAYKLVPEFTQEDIDYLRKENLNYHDDSSAIVGESLHDLYSAMRREMKK